MTYLSRMSRILKLYIYFFASAGKYWIWFVFRLIIIYFNFNYSLLYTFGYYIQYITCLLNGTLCSLFIFIFALPRFECLFCVILIFSNPVPGIYSYSTAISIFLHLLLERKIVYAIYQRQSWQEFMH